MRTKIKEIVLEPTKIFVGSTFKIKVKAIRGLTYEEMKEIKVKNLKKYKCLELRGG